MKSLHANTCCQLYLHKVGFAARYPKLNTKGDILGETLDDLVHDFGAPEHLTFDGFNLNSIRISISSRIFANIILITMYLHCDSPMKTL